MAIEDIQNLIKGEPDWHLKINSNNTEIKNNSTSISNKIGDLTTSTNTNKSNVVEITNEINASLIDLSQQKANQSDLEILNTNITNNTTMLNDITKKNIKQGTKNDIRFYNMLTFPTLAMNSIDVMGDSISHGANCPNMSNDSWTGIMRKFIQLEYNTKNYGYVHMLSSLANGNGTYNEVHTVDLSGATGGWTYTENADALANDYINAPNGSGGGIDIHMSKPSKYFKVNYIQANGFGNLDIYVDNVLRGTINCSNATSNSYKMSQEFLGNESSAFKITIIKTDTFPIVINGIFYYDNISNVIFNNFARNGVALKDISNASLNVQANANYVFFALGTNDGDAIAFESKITHLISTFNTNLCKVIVLDFLWYKQIETDAIKQQIKRLADNTNSIYIDFNKILGNKDMSTLQALGFLSDSVHPTPTGHQLIAEVVAKTVGFNITSKKIAERLLV